MWQNGDHPNLIDLKNICYQPLAIIFEYVSFSFSPFGANREFIDWMGFKGLWIIFWLKLWSSSFSESKFSFDCSLKFLHNNGIAHRDLKPVIY